MPEIQQGRPDDGYKPFQLIGVIVIALLGFAVFFLSFLLAPLAILALFYVGFATSDRNKRNGNGNGNGHEPPPEAPVVEVQAAPAPPQRATAVTLAGEARAVPPSMVTPGTPRL